MAQEQRLYLDPQTFTELEIFPREGDSMSIFKLLDKTVTPGGHDLLRKRFRNPLNNRDQIIRVQESIRYISNHPGEWDLSGFSKLMDQVEYYYYSKAETITSRHPFLILVESLIYRIKYRDFRRQISLGTRNTILFLLRLDSFCRKNKSGDLPPLLAGKFNEMEDILKSRHLSRLLGKKPGKEWSLTELFFLDKIFRDVQKADLLQLIHGLYEMDVLISMARSVTDCRLVFPCFLDAGKSQLRFENLYHLFLKNPVGNTLEFSTGRNFLFLTGPNMAGKTTFLKSCGVAVFLAHLGMGVPAKSMELTVFNALFTSLNTTDNLSIGYSYFYSEVMRIKKAAEILHQYGKVFMLFDELFKGTNIKDAVDGSLMVIEGLTKWDQAIYILSSHLIELSKEICRHPNIFFSYFDSAVTGGKPTFSFTLHDGTSQERLGLIILENENIRKLLDPEIPGGKSVP